MRRLYGRHLPPLRLAARRRRRTGHRLILALAALAACLSLSACGAGSSSSPGGVAFAGPKSLDLYSELAVNAPVAGHAQHGDRLQILAARRRFVRVRTKDGVEGWTDSAYLLTQSELQDLSELARSAASRPVQGIGTVFDTLNVHTAPSRTATSFAQLAARDKVEVIAHRVTLRDSDARPVAKTLPVPEEPQKPSPEEAVPEEEPVDRVPDQLVPPPPDAPAPPANWEQLSHPRLFELPGWTGELNSRVDDWWLVRIPDGRAGWVLMRSVFMTIPDEIGQYAEGNFVTSYHQLGEAHDETLGTKGNWMWTTSSRRQSTEDFDSFRVFYFNTRRHRYETAHIERGLKGHYPVETFEEPGKAGIGISMIVEDSDAQLYRRKLWFDGDHVRNLSKEPYQSPAPLPEVRMSETFDLGPPVGEEGGLLGTMRRLSRQWFAP